MFSSPKYLEFFPASSGKGEALEKLCEILNIPTMNAIAAGDQENDLSMLTAAGTSIAMCNGIESLKEAADIVTVKDNNNDGLAEVLAGLF
jgi:hydroxymethylpyrimidine pyrophosphatase-like HAD family hydrolase